MECVITQSFTDVIFNSLAIISCDLFFTTHTSVGYVCIKVYMLVL